MKQPWVVFYDANGRELLAFTVCGMAQGEIGATISLLAYEKGISEDEISYKVVVL